MRKMLAIAAAVGLSAATAIPAVAQPYGYDHRDHRYDRDRDYRHDGGRHYGWRHRGVAAPGWYYWRGQRWQHRNWECRWRFGRKVCTYRYW